MAEDPKNPFSGPLGTRNMGRARTGAAGGGGKRTGYRNLGRDIGVAMRSSLKRDDRLVSDIGKAMRKGVSDDRKAQAKADKALERIEKWTK